MRRLKTGTMLLVALVAWLSAARAEDHGLIAVKMNLQDMSAPDRAKLWVRLDEYAKADSILEFCGRKLNLYKRTWNAVSPCVETSALRKVGASFLSKKSKYLEILGGNYAGDDAKKAFCTGFQPQMKSYVEIIEKHISEARGMCDACMWC